MTSATPRLKLSRSQILCFRRTVNSLNQRLPPGAPSLRRTAWAGLQDSMPRAALLSIHARVERTSSAAWEHPSLTQLWGPRFSAYVVPANDLAVFSLGRLPDAGPRRQRAHETAARLHAFLNGRRMPDRQAGRGLGVHPNSLRYAAPTGTVLIRWDGARQPELWTVCAPNVDPHHARLELLRRYLHIFGPATPSSFAKWAGISPGEARRAFDALASELTATHTPIGDAWILASDEPTFLTPPVPAASARLLPSGDAYFLLWGSDRRLLIPDRKSRSALWTSRVWPGALLVNGEIAGVWRRAASDVSIEPWRHLSSKERPAIEAEALSLPLPGPIAPITVRWLR